VFDTTTAQSPHNKRDTAVSGIRLEALTCGDVGHESLAGEPTDDHVLQHQSTRLAFIDAPVSW